MKLKTLLKTFVGPLFLYTGMCSDSLEFIGKVHSVAEDGFYTSSIDYLDAEVAKNALKVIKGLLDCTVEQIALWGNHALSVYLK